MATTQLSIWLLKPNAPKHPLKSDHEYSIVVNEAVEVSGASECWLVVAQGKRGLPAWWNFLSYFDISWPQSLKRRSTGAVLFLTTQSRRWALTFGTAGRPLLDLSHVVRNFGLRTSVNAVDPQSIRLFSTQKFDAVFRRIIEHASLNATSHAFGVDTDQDLLRAISGKPIDNSLGSKVGGTDSVTLATTKGIGSLPGILKTLGDASESSVYIERGLDWIDRISQVVDNDELKTLDLELDKRLSASNASTTIGLLMPDDTALQDYSTVRYTEKLSYSGLQFEQFIHHMKRTDAVYLKNKKIIFTDDEGNTQTAPAYKCLVAQVAGSSGESYFLIGGQWYRVAADWLSGIDQALSKIPDIQGLPQYDKHTDEADWLQDAKKKFPKSQVTDQKLIQLGGSSVEFCDIYDGHRLIHAKRFSSSKSVSHLITQAAVSAEGWQSPRPEFREQVNKKLKTHLRLSNPKTRPNPADYTISLVLIGGGPELPFLSRVRLRRFFEEASGYGFKVEFTRVRQVPIEKAKKK